MTFARGAGHDMKMIRQHVRYHARFFTRWAFHLCGDLLLDEEACILNHLLIPLKFIAARR